MKIDQIIGKIKKVKPELEKKFGIGRIGIFGSYVKGYQNEESDIDIILELRHPTGLIKFIRIEQYLSDILGKSVDLLTFNSLKSYMKDEVLREIKYV